MAENGAEAEDVLWAMGVGEALPEWLKELRKKERAEGKNQGPFMSPQPQARPGIGPMTPGSRPVQSGGAGEVPSMPRPSDRPSSSSAAPASASSSSAGPAPAPKPVPRPSPAPAAERAAEQRVDPDDGRAYTLESLAERYKGKFSRAEIEDYFKNDCTAVSSAPSRPKPEADRAPVAERAPAAPPTPAVEEAKPAAKAPVKRFDISIKDWLAALDDSGFVAQYHDAIIANFDSVEQIVDIYWKAGELDKQFFADVGIKKLGHKRLFEKWFKDQLS